jgi:hypothetical protein
VPAVLPAERIPDKEGALMESAQSEGAEVDVPFAVVATASGLQARLSWTSVPTRAATTHP